MTKFQLCLLTSLCFLLLAISSFAQSARELKKEREKIAKQRIETMTIREYDIEEESGKYKKAMRIKSIYKYDSKGNEIEDTAYCTECGSSIFKQKYDDKGNMIECAKYDTDGELESKNIYKHKYDDKGNIIEEATYNIKDGKEIPQSQTVYEYTFYQPSDNSGQKSENPEKK